MNSEKYIRLDVSSGNDLSCGPGFQRQVSNRSILETQAATILEFLAGLRGTLWVTFEERNLGRLAIRFAQAACGPLDRVQSAEERSSQTIWSRFQLDLGQPPMLDIKAL
jgi:hypothetical protein